MIKALIATSLLFLLAPQADAQPARQLLNGMRAEAGLGPVAPSALLEDAAMAHAMDMARNGFISHTGSDGSSTEERARRAGYDFCTIAENIGQGQDSLTEVLGTWAQSAQHRRTMLETDVTDYGLVRAPGDIWVLVLGRDGC